MAAPSVPVVSALLSLSSASQLQDYWCSRPAPAAPPLVPACPDLFMAVDHILTLQLQNSPDVPRLSIDIILYLFKYIDTAELLPYCDEVVDLLDSLLKLCLSYHHSNIWSAITDQVFSLINLVCMSEAKLCIGVISSISEAIFKAILLDCDHYNPRSFVSYYGMWIQNLPKKLLDTIENKFQNYLIQLSSKIILCGDYFLQSAIIEIFFIFLSAKSPQQKASSINTWFSQDSLKGVRKLWLKDNSEVTARDILNCLNKAFERVVSVSCEDVYFLGTNKYTNQENEEYVFWLDINLGSRSLTFQCSNESGMEHMLVSFEDIEKVVYERYQDGSNKITFFFKKLDTDNTSDGDLSLYLTKQSISDLNPKKLLSILPKTIQFQFQELNTENSGEILCTQKISKSLHKIKNSNAPRLFLATKRILLPTAEPKLQDNTPRLFSATKRVPLPIAESKVGACKSLKDNSDKIPELYELKNLTPIVENSENEFSPISSPGSTKKLLSFEQELRVKLKDLELLEEIKKKDKLPLFEESLTHNIQVIQEPIIECDNKFEPVNEIIPDIINSSINKPKKTKRKKMPRKTRAMLKIQLREPKKPTPVVSSSDDEIGEPPQKRYSLDKTAVDVFFEQAVNERNTNMMNYSNDPAFIRKCNKSSSESDSSDVEGANDLEYGIASPLIREPIISVPTDSGKHEICRETPKKDETLNLSKKRKLLPKNIEPIHEFIKSQEIPNILKIDNIYSIQNIDNDLNTTEKNETMKSVPKRRYLKIHKDIPEEQNEIEAQPDSEMIFKEKPPKKRQSLKQNKKPTKKPRLTKNTAKLSIVKSVEVQKELLINMSNEGINCENILNTSEPNTAILQEEHKSPILEHGLKNNTVLGQNSYSKNQNSKPVKQRKAKKKDKYTFLPLFLKNDDPKRTLEKLPDLIVEYVQKPCLFDNSSVERTMIKPTGLIDTSDKEVDFPTEEHYSGGNGREEDKECDANADLEQVQIVVPVTVHPPPKLSKQCSLVNISDELCPERLPPGTPDRIATSPHKPSESLENLNDDNIISSASPPARRNNSWDTFNKLRDDDTIHSASPAALSNAGTNNCTKSFDNSKDDDIQSPSPASQSKAERNNSTKSFDNLKDDDMLSAFPACQFEDINNFKALDMNNHVIRSVSPVRQNSAPRYTFSENNFVDEILNMDDDVAKLPHNKSDSFNNANSNDLNMDTLIDMSKYEYNISPISLSPASNIPSPIMKKVIQPNKKKTAKKVLKKKKSLKNIIQSQNYESQVEEEISQYKTPEVNDEVQSFQSTVNEVTSLINLNKNEPKKVVEDNNNRTDYDLNNIEKDSTEVVNMMFCQTCKNVAKALGFESDEHMLNVRHLLKRATDDFTKAIMLIVKKNKI